METSQNIENFKDFLGYNYTVPASRARGSVTITRVSNSDVLNIKTTDEFRHRGLNFVLTLPLQIPANSVPITVKVISRETGPKNNLPASLEFTLFQAPKTDRFRVPPPSPVAVEGLTIRNAEAFTGGMDERKVGEISGIIDGKINVDSDVILQLHLDTGIAFIKRYLGYEQTEALPDFPEIDSSVYLISQYYLNNRMVQERQTQFKTPKDTFSETLKRKYRDNVLYSVLQQIDTMISHHRRVGAFIPSGELERSMSL